MMVSVYSFPNIFTWVSFADPLSALPIEFDFDTAPTTTQSRKDILLGVETLKVKNDVQKWWTKRLYTKQCLVNMFFDRLLFRTLAFCKSSKHENYTQYWKRKNEFGQQESNRLFNNKKTRTQSCQFIIPDWDESYNIIFFFVFFSFDEKKTM